MKDPIKQNSVLVTGGAGYIGSHVALTLQDQGWNPIVLDNLSVGTRETLPADIPLIEGDVSDTNLLTEILADYNCSAVIHLAGSVVVGDSVLNPLKYYRNNTFATASLLEACLQAEIHHVVFSSSAAVYGEPSKTPISEDDPTMPINPYGRSKLAIEWILRDVAASSSLRYATLRYFNVAGADPQGRTGQSASSELTHLIKVACHETLRANKEVSVFGTDYDTPDGSCVRDYVHVSDLAMAHVQVLQYLINNGESQTFNCGYGKGYSVLEVLHRLQEISCIPLRIKKTERRAGDPVKIVADASKLRKTVGWKPQYDNLDIILKTCLDWERRLME